MINVALDAMGGDCAPQGIINGAIRAIEELGVSILLVGPTQELERELDSLATVPTGLELVDAPDVVVMDEAPTVVLRSKARSSLNRCAELIRDGRAQAMVSAGNTGAAWVAAKATLGMIEGVDRPALAVVLPRLQGRTLLLDVGANIDCKPRHLVEYAVMGSFYAEAVLGVGEPSVGLLSVGEEKAKGGRRVREQYEVLARTGIRFVGTVEGRDVFAGDTDVVVCDGFTGNVLLKAAEGLGELVIASLKEEARSSPVWSAGLVMAKGAFRNVRKRVDYSEYGGAPLLGINGACLIAHGRSTPTAISNAIRSAVAYGASGVMTRIADKMADVLDNTQKRERLTWTTASTEQQE